MRLPRISALVLIAALPLASHAADLGAANGFNAFVFGNASLNGGHSDGAIAVGGSVASTDYTVLNANLPATVESDAKVGFYVGGNAAFSSKLTVNNSGNARVGGAYSGETPVLNGGTLYQGSTAALNTSLFTNQKAYSQSQSSYLLSLGGTAVNTADANNWHIDASTAVASGSAKIVTIPASLLSGTQTLDVQNLLASQTLIINVTGTGDVSDFGVTFNGSYDRLLWNYGGSGSFNVTGRALHGSLLAPNATVTTSQNIDGNLIANAWTNNGSAEVHFGSGTTFAGFVPQAVPEPGTWAALGLAGAAFLRRRRG